MSKTQVIVLDNNVGEVLNSMLDSINKLNDVLKAKKVVVNHEYYTLKQFADKHPGLTLSALRKYWFFRDFNGFNRVAHKIPEGQTVLIDEAEFDKWLKGQQING